jgi:Family of unknown function (DUF6401)
MPLIDPACPDLPGMVLRLAGEAGQVSLGRTADSPGARASVDQHAAEIRDALASRGRPVTTAALLSYAQGFTEAAISRGWWPPHRRGALAEEDALDHAGPANWAVPLGGDCLDPDSLDAPEPALDWESLRLAAICRMLIEAQGLAP